MLDGNYFPASIVNLCILDLPKICNYTQVDGRTYIYEARRNFCETPTSKLRKTPPHLPVQGLFHILQLHDMLLMRRIMSIRQLEQAWGPLYHSTAAGHIGGGGI